MITDEYMDYCAKMKVWCKELNHSEFRDRLKECISDSVNASLGVDYFDEDITTTKVLNLLREYDLLKGR